MLWIEGYLEQYSVAPGETIRLLASANVRWCSIEIHREGLAPVCVHRETRIEIGQHPIPSLPWETGAQWPVCWEFKIPANWPSAAYRIDLIGGGISTEVQFTRWSQLRARHSILLIVRTLQPGSASKVLLQLSTNTYRAYNSWGGRSVYAYNSKDALSPRVSVLRPGHGYCGDSLSHAEFPQWELPFVRWCEREGIALEFAANEDIHCWPAGFDSYNLILSAGHDEYWSAGMRDNLEAFIARGGNAAFFSGNSVCWQIRYEDGLRTMVCYKYDYQSDPAYKDGRHRDVTTLWSHPLLKRPENQLTGVGFPMGGYHRFFGQFMDSPGAYTVRNSKHWIFEKTGLHQGETFGGVKTPPPATAPFALAQQNFYGPAEVAIPRPILGYEADGCRYREVDGKPVPTGEDGTPLNFEILAQCPVRWFGTEITETAAVESGVAQTGCATMGIYKRPGGGSVFTAGTSDWACGLDRDRAVQQITRNVLDRLCKREARE